MVLELQLQLRYLKYFIIVGANSAGDLEETKDFDPKEISGNGDISDRDTKDVGSGLTEKVRAKNSLKTVKKPVRKISAPATRVYKISSQNKGAILRGKCRTRRQLENISNCFRLPRVTIKDPIKNQIETDLELTEEYNLNGRSKSSLGHHMSRHNESQTLNVVFQSKLFSHNSRWSRSKISTNTEEKTLSISSNADTDIVLNIEQLCLVKVRRIQYDKIVQ